MLKINLKNKKGFSLVEMLVAIGIFMSIMTIAVSALISIVGANKKAQAIKSTIDSVTFALEDISRDMRMGTDYKCSIDGTNFYTACVNNGQNVGGKAVRFINAGGKQTTTYTYNGKADPNDLAPKGVLTVETLPCADTSLSSCPEDLISQDANVNLTNMSFYIIGTDNESNPDQSQKTQPRVVITASGLISSKGSTDTLFNLQTNISQRARR